jgi:hypothetical protein
MFENVNLLVVVAGLFLTVFGAVWSLAWWLSGQFTAIRNLVYTTAEKTRDTILTKLEYHEKHDDTRFNGIHDRIKNLGDDIWDIRVRNASRDHMPTLQSRDRTTE